MLTRCTRAGAEGLGHERDRVLGPLDDVDLLAAQLADDGLHARAAHADAGADRIDVALAREDRDLGAVARLADGAANHHRAVVDLRHFLLEQLDEQRRIGARQDDLRALGVLRDRLDDGAHAVADGVVLRARLFLARNLRFDAADFRDDVAALEALDHRVDDLADALAELAVDLLALGLAHALGDDLLGGLRGDAAELLGFLRELDLHPDFGFLAVELLGLAERDLPGGVGHVGHDLPHGVELDLPGFQVEPRSQVLVALEHLARGRQVGVLDGANHDGRIDALVLRDDIDHLLQFGSHIVSLSQNSTSSRARLIRSQRHPMRAPPLFEYHRARVHPDEPARKMRLALDRCSRHNLRQPSRRTADSRLLPEAAGRARATRLPGCTPRANPAVRSSSTSSSALRSWLTR